MQAIASGAIEGLQQARRIIALAERPRVFEPRKNAQMEEAYDRLQELKKRKDKEAQ